MKAFMSMGVVLSDVTLNETTQGLESLRLTPLRSQKIRGVQLHGPCYRNEAR